MPEFLHYKEMHAAVDELGLGPHGSSPGEPAAQSVNLESVTAAF